MLAKSTSREEWKTAFVPLPWCTSQSSTSTRSTPSESSAWRAAIDTVAKRQKPIARAGSQWWPGGRSAEKPTRSPSRSSESTSAQAPPAACSAASHDPGLSGVSRSNAPPRALSSRTASTCSRGCTASSWSSSAAGASRRS